MSAQLVRQLPRGMQASRCQACPVLGCRANIEEVVSRFAMRRGVLPETTRVRQALFDAAPAADRVLPAKLRFLEASDFVCQKHVVDILNEHGLSIHTLTFERCFTPDPWGAFEIHGALSGSANSVWASGRTPAEAYWHFKRWFSRWRRCPDRKCGRLHDGACQADALREEMSFKGRCTVCTTRTTDFYLLKCGHSVTCKSCLLKMCALGKNNCPICRAPFTVDAGWGERSAKKARHA